MNITVSKVIRELEHKYGWYRIDATKNLLIADVIKVIDQELIKHKNISIKNRKNA